MKRTLSAVALSAVACSAGDAPSVTLGKGEDPKIIGDDDLVRVAADGSNVPARYRPLLDAFGRLSNHCSATHLGRGFVLTAGHCFGAPAVRRDDSPCRGVRVEWGYRKDRPAYLTSDCQVVLAAEQSLARDYAVLVVRPIPEAAVAVSTRRPDRGAAVTIFSHPLRRPLAWSQRCTVEPRDELLAVGSDGTWGEDMFTHQCDTERGSSGGAILDDATLAVVGVHNGGIDPWNYATFVDRVPIAEHLAPDFDVPPIVDFTAPATGGTLRGSVPIAVDARDVDGRVTEVRFLLAEATVVRRAPPWETRWDTRTARDGHYTLAATAIDDRGRETTARKSVRVQNAP